MCACVALCPAPARSLGCNAFGMRYGIWAQHTAPPEAHCHASAPAFTLLNTSYPVTPADPHPTDVEAHTLLDGRFRQSGGACQAHLPLASAPETGEKGSFDFSGRLPSPSPLGESGTFGASFCSFPKNLAVSHANIAILRSKRMPYSVRSFLAVSLLRRTARATRKRSSRVTFQLQPPTTHPPSLPSLCLSLSLSLSLSLPLDLCLCLSLTLSLFLDLSLPVSVCRQASRAGACLRKREGQHLQCCADGSSHCAMEEAVGSTCVSTRGKSTPKRVTNWPTSAKCRKREACDIAKNIWKGKQYVKRRRGQRCGCAIVSGSTA